MIGRMHRELTGGDLCEVLVDVSAHRHHGHNSDIKVRPTVGITHFVSRPREAIQLCQKSVRSVSYRLSDTPLSKIGNP